MREIGRFTIHNTVKQIGSKILNWGQQFSHFALYPGNEYPDPYHQYDLVFGADAEDIFAFKDSQIDSLYKNWKKQPDWLFGHLGYDLKNEIEELESSNQDLVKAADLYFFKPKIVGYLKENELTIECVSISPKLVFDQINKTAFLTQKQLPKIGFNQCLSKIEYVDHVHALQRHIQQGNIYEINFCQEFYAENTEILPEQVFAQLNAKAHPPFAAFLNLPKHAVLCASPERYLQKSGSRLISQPIKGTAKRSTDKSEDESIKSELFNSVKERAENVMIVDLVRNDLSKVSTKNSVQVPELFGVHTFPTVHQLISTIKADLAENQTWADVLKASFPMGSMTGAPKVNAMRLIEEYEFHKRGIYSGAIGYITPKGDFDFNVVIRSLLYNKVTKYLSLSVGGAITILADAEEEYDECLLKAEALLKLFS